MRARGAKVTDIVSWSSPPMMASCRRRWRPSATPRPRACRSSSPSTRSTSPTPSRIALRNELLQYEIQVEIARRRCARGRSFGTREPISTSCWKLFSLQAEVLDLKANPHRNARRRRRRGQARSRTRPCRDRAGAARHAQPATSWWPDRHGAAYARCSTSKARRSQQAGPSTPVEVLGFNGTPDAGDGFAVVEARRAPARSPPTAPARSARSRWPGSRGRAARSTDMMQDLKTGRPQGVAARRQGRCAGFGRGDRRRAREARQ